MIGTVSNLELDRGYGFIKPHDRNVADQFFHASELRGGLVFDARLQERRVEFDLAERRGRERAINVRPAD